MTKQANFWSKHKLYLKFIQIYLKFVGFLVFEKLIWTAKCQFLVFEQLI